MSPQWLLNKLDSQRKSGYKGKDSRKDSLESCIKRDIQRSYRWFECPPKAASMDTVSQTIDRCR